MGVYFADPGIHTYSNSPPKTSRGPKRASSSTRFDGADECPIVPAPSPAQRAAGGEEAHAFAN